MGAERDCRVLVSIPRRLSADEIIERGTHEQLLAQNGFYMQPAGKPYNAYQMLLTKPIAALCCPLLLATVTPPAYSAPPMETAASDYSAGVSLVYRGRRLETAIQKLDQAVRKEPSNSDYHLALGCALVRRAVVLHRAAIGAYSYELTKAAYPARYATWEKAQADRKSLLYGINPPVPPLAPTTTDDDKPFTLTTAQAKDRANALCERALAEWDAAIAKSDTDAERANAHFVRGWGMVLILRSGRILSAPWLKEILVPNHDKIADEFRAALAVEPKNAKYWQSLGDAYVSDAGPLKWSRKEAAAAYEKALALDKRSPTLWWQLYRIQEESDPDAALAAITGACKIEPSNAYYAYLQAYLLLKRFAGKAGDYAATEAEKSVARPPDTHSPDLSAGLAALDRGNTGTFRPNSYLYGIPKILAPLEPNDIGISYALYDTFIILIPQNVGIAVKTQLATGDSAAAVAAGRAAARFGENMMTIAETLSIDANEFLAWISSGAAIHSGYTALIEALEGAGNDDAAAEARARLQVLDAQARQRTLQASEKYRAFLQ